MAELTIRAPQPDEYTAVGTLMAEIFFKDEPRFYEQFLHHWIAHRPRHPGFNLNNIRVGFLKREPVSVALVERSMLHYGQAYLKVGGIGNVGTAPPHRGRGYASAVMKDTLTYIAEQGAHLAVLDGIPNYYTRFGFYAVWPFYTMTFDSHEAAALRPIYRLRPAKPLDAPELSALYDKHWGGRVAFARGEDLWEWRIATENLLPLVIEAPDGTVRGYIRGLFNTMLQRVEVVVDDCQAAVAALQAGGRQFARLGVQRVRWLVPPDDLLVMCARRMIPCSLAADYSPNGGWQARLINTTALVEELLPELALQAHLTDPDLKPVDLDFQCQPDVVRIGLRSKPATFCELNHQDFIQVMFGSQRPAALAAQRSLTPQSVRLLEILFPPRMAVLGGWDWF